MLCRRAFRSCWLAALQRSDRNLTPLSLDSRNADPLSRNIFSNFGDRPTNVGNAPLSFEFFPKHEEKPANPRIDIARVLERSITIFFFVANASLVARMIFSTCRAVAEPARPTVKVLELSVLVMIKSCACRSIFKGQPPPPHDNGQKLVNSSCSNRFPSIRIKPPKVGLFLDAPQPFETEFSHNARRWPDHASLKINHRAKIGINRDQ